MPTDSAGYVEFNFSPSTEWALFGFTAYREGMSPVEVDHPPTLAVRCNPHRLELDALIGSFARWGPIRESERLIFGLTAVIEDLSGERSYWALSHPSDHPDFHHPDSFALTLGGSEPLPAQTSRSR
jgi:hypothetical protein